MNTKDIVGLFKSKGLKATPQRIAVYEYLHNNHIHPDVETVYENVKKDNPSFSKTTVYNCLQVMADYGLLKPVMIDCDRIRYDANTDFHGHFRCERCGRIYDFECDLDIPVGIDGIKINHKDIYYSGICNCCE